MLAAGGAALAALAGCTGGSDDGDAAQTDAQTTTDESGDPSALSFAANFARQPSADAPPRLDVTLSNSDDAPVLLAAGDQLFAGFFSTVYQYELVPAGDDVETQEAGGCRRVSVDSETGQPDTSAREVPGGGAIEESYDVYTQERADECFPDGSSAITRGLEVRGADEVELNLQFSVEDEQFRVADGKTNVSVTE